MAVYSMTGYASLQDSPSTAQDETAASAQNQPRISLEIRSVNSRFLDLSFKLPEEFRQHEMMLRELALSKLKRGKVEIRANIEYPNGEILHTPSSSQLQKLNILQDQIRSWLPQATPLGVADVIKLCQGAAKPASDAANHLKTLAESALQALLESRQSEGHRLVDMLRDRIGQLRLLVEQATPLIPQLVEQQRQRFLERWSEAINSTENGVLPEMAQDRALTEATAYAIRIDVAEEISRLGSHLTEISNLLDKGGDLGKRLDFLIQELHREANTLGSKSSTLELTRISVEMKVLIEQMREQVQNIE